MSGQAGWNRGVIYVSLSFSHLLFNLIVTGTETFVFVVVTNKIGGRT